MKITQGLPKQLTKHWMLQKEASEELGVTIKTLWEWRNQGLLESRKYAGRVLIRRSDVRKKLINLELA